MSDTGSDPNETHIVNYVPDEIGIVVEAAEVDASSEPKFYDYVRSQLNRQIAMLLRGNTEQPRDPFEHDLTPTVLRARFAGNRAVLQPLGRPKRPGTARDDRDATPVTPWLRVERRQGRTKHHLYFHLGPGPTASPGRLDADQLRLALQSVRELVLLLNRAVRGAQQRPFGNVTWSVAAASPNWLTVAYQFACGCPAGLPVAVHSRRRGFPFEFRGALNEALAQPSRGEVIVAVLDTSPSQVAVEAAADKFPGNELLNQVRGQVEMNSPALLSSAAAGLGAHLDGVLPRLQWDMRAGPVPERPEDYTLADHGLFVAGVVADILGKSGRVHLIRVLNDAGIGDVLAISHALTTLLGVFLGGYQRPEDEPRLVVNLSLGIDVPVPMRLLDRWLPQTAHNLDALRSRQPDIADTLDLVHANLADVVGALLERGVLVVAAAGNDALRADLEPGQRPPPRYPARYSDVLSVAATRRDVTAPANYSNKGETVPSAVPGDLATFGGTIVGAGPNAPGTTDDTDGVVGIFSAPKLPGGATNSSGWVRWAGTSFSTPIVAATAARLWATRPHLKAPEVVSWLHSFGRHPHGGLDPDSPLEVPVLPVWQR